MVGGDFDGDGNDDLAIGVPYQEVLNGYTIAGETAGEIMVNAGAVHVLYEDVHFGPGLSAEADQVLHQNTQLAIY